MPKPLCPHQASFSAVLLYPLLLDFLDVCQLVGNTLALAYWMPFVPTRVWLFTHAEGAEEAPHPNGKPKAGKAGTAPPWYETRLRGGWGYSGHSFSRFTASESSSDDASSHDDNQAAKPRRRLAGLLSLLLAAALLVVFAVGPQPRRAPELRPELPSEAFVSPPPGTHRVGVSALGFSRFVRPLGVAFPDASEVGGICCIHNQTDGATHVLRLHPAVAFAHVIGWPRSGSSLLAALLDGHRQVGFGNEFDTMSFFAQHRCVAPRQPPKPHGEPDRLTDQPTD